MTINELNAHLRAKLKVLHPRIIDEFPVENYLGAVLKYPAVAAYNHVSPEIYQLERALNERIGVSGAALYFQLVLCELIQKNAPVMARGALPESVKSRFLVNVERITSDIEKETHPAVFYRHDDDKFLKDVGVAALRVLPAGAQKINQTRLPLRIAKGLEQLKLVAFAALYLGKQGPIFDMHTDSHDPDLLAAFSETGWRDFYKTVAQVLEQNPQVIGLFGIGWFFDPAVTEVSPRLAYLRDIALESGARSFCVGPTEGARESALATSATRRKLYDEGRYVPQDHLVVWSRKSLIAWSKCAA
jgi:hypothetical protein